MIDRKKLTRLALVAIAFIAADAWIYSSLRGAFRSLMSDTRFKEITLFAKTAPRDAALQTDWLKGAVDLLPGSRSVYLATDASGELAVVAGDRGLAGLLRSAADQPDFKKGIDSVRYLEPFVSAKEYSIAGGEGTGDPGRIGSARPEAGRVYFAPVPDDTGADIRGALVILSANSATDRFDALLLGLAIVAFLIFIAIYSVLAFSRDPAMGFAIIGLFAIVAAFVAYPLFEAVRLTFVEKGSFSLGIWKAILTPRYLEALWGSVRLGLWTATFSTLVGFAFAFLVERSSVGGKKFISTMATLPVISPPFSLTLSIILLFGNNGLISRQLLGLSHFTIYGLNGLVIVQTIGMFPIAFMTLSSVLRAIDSTVEDAALDLGASRLRTFLTITLPLSTPGILSAWLLVFTNSLADFANPLLLSGSYRVLSIEAYMEVTGRNNLGGGAALSLLLLLPTLTAFFAQRYWITRKSYVTVTGKPSTRLTELASGPVRVALLAFVGFCVVFIVALYGTIVAGCFVKNWGIDYSFTLSNIPEALSRGWKAIADTVTLAAIATPIAGLLAMAAALVVVRSNFFGKRLLEALIMTPFAVPGTLIGIAYILAFNKPPLLLVGTAAIIVLNYVVRELPVGLETGAASLRQIDPAIEEAARDLGADTPTVFRTIVLPLIRPAFISSMSYTFVRSMTAVSAIIFLISARWYHLTVQIYNFSELLRFGWASVLATTLIVIVLAAFGLMRLLVRDEGLTEKTISQ
ncbi:MAG TPA: iron ABC transporter permease [Rectinemataceae bacterium]|nr:iron ABC transporter permease [Rectinemataceae bacterium]